MCCGTVVKSGVESSRRQAEEAKQDERVGTFARRRRKTRRRGHARSARRVPLSAVFLMSADSDASVAEITLAVTLWSPSNYYH